MTRTDKVAAAPPAPALRKVRTIVYGATGHAGSQVCAALVRDGATVLALGRDEKKLDALVRGLGSDAEWAIAAADDEARLRALMARGSVVINCAGPFASYGRAVQNAALATGCHCLDMAGEPAFVRATLERDAEAKARDVLLVSGVGFDVVPTDALAALLAESVGGEIRAARVAYSRLDAGPTAGLGRTMVQGLLDGGRAFVDGAWRVEPLGHDTWAVRFPGQPGPVSCLSLPWGDVASLPETTGAPTARAYLPRTWPAPGPASALLRAFRWVLPVRVFARLADWIARRMVQRLPLSTPEPSRFSFGHSRNRNASASVSAVVEVTGRLGAKAGWVLAEPGIAVQAVALCARIAAAPAFAARGALTPSRAFGARRLLDELERNGLRWGVAA